MSLNSVNILGRLTADPEKRTTTNGTDVVSFTIAVDKPYNKEHEHPEADFIDCVAWKERAGFLCTYFKKGSRVLLEGRLASRSFEDKNGIKRKVTEVIVNSIHFVDKKADLPISPASPPPSVKDNKNVSYDESTVPEENGEDDDETVPF